jgi:hypothetical protein
MATTDTQQAHMLTTVDNPFNPWTDYDEWLAFDEDNGYYSNALLARIVVTSDALSEADQQVAIENGISEIISENVSGMHKSITEDGS